MPIFIVTPAETADFTTLAKVKDLLDIDVADTDKDDLLGDMIEETTDLITRITGRNWARRKVRETLPGYGSNQMLLSVRPVVSIDSLKFRDGEAINAETYQVDSEAGILYLQDGNLSTHAILLGVTEQPLAGSEFPHYECIYTGGYHLARYLGEDDAPTPNFPATLRMAAHDWIAYRWSVRSEGSGLKSKRLGDATWTYSEESAIQHIESMLSHLKASK